MFIVLHGLYKINISLYCYSLTHILSEGEFDIYGYDVELIFKNYIREEIKFNDEKELINQINLDKEYCINN